MQYPSLRKLAFKVALGVGTALAALAPAARPAGASAVAPTSFGTALSFSVGGDFGYAQGPGQSGQTYYYDFLDLRPASITLGFVYSNLSLGATGPLSLYTASGASVSAGSYGDYALTPGLYYVAFAETTPGYNRLSGQLTSDYDLSLSASPPPPTLPIGQFFSLTPRDTGALIAAVPTGYVPAAVTPQTLSTAVPEGSDLALLALGLLPVGAVALRRRAAKA